MKRLKFMKDVLKFRIITYKKILRFKSCFIKTYKTGKKSRNNKNFVGTVLMDLFKAFDYIPHDLLPARLHVHS